MSTSAPAYVVLVTGSRHHDNWSLIQQTLDEIHAARAITRIVHGAAPGADALASQWAHLRNVDVYAYGARWGEEGRYAGPKRNLRMITKENPDLVVGFPIGASYGTTSCMNLARRAGIEVRVVHPQ